MSSDAPEDPSGPERRFRGVRGVSPGEAALEENAFLGELSAGVIYLLAGVRLLLLGRRTGEAPERFLGASFAMIGISGILYCLPEFEVFRVFQTPMFFAARVSYLPGSLLIAVFTAHVFRSDARWARWLVWGTAGMAAGGVTGSVLQGDWEGFSLENTGFWFEWAGYTLPFCWAAAEAFPQYRRARRRVKMALCEPSVCNRMLLWSLFGVAQLTSCCMVIGQYAAFERENVFSSTWDTLYSISMLTALVVMWVAFFPPKLYIRWINRSIAQAGIDGDH